MTRSAMLEVLGEDYVRTARAKGLSPFRVVGLHALRNALIPVVTMIGLQVGVLMAGAILTETIFSWPGIGKWMIESIGRRDYPALQGGVLLISRRRDRRQPRSSICSTASSIRASAMAADAAIATTIAGMRPCAPPSPLRAFWPRSARTAARWSASSSSS